MDDGVICRWVHRDSGVLFDLMPVEPEVLCFSNPWYRYAVDSAEWMDLGNGIGIRRVSAVAFVATKLEAFRSRAEMLADPERLQKTRERLASLSWFMKCLNEHVSRIANAEGAFAGIVRPRLSSDTSPRASGPRCAYGTTLGRIRLRRHAGNHALSSVTSE